MEQYITYDGLLAAQDKAAVVLRDAEKALREAREPEAQAAPSEWQKLQADVYEARKAYNRSVGDVMLARVRGADRQPNTAVKV